MALDDYGSIIQAGMQLVPDLNRQLLEQAQTNSFNANTQQSQAQTAAIGQKMSRAQQFQRDIATYDGSPGAVSRLIAQYPEYADQLKSSWDVMDGAKKQSDLTQTGEIYSAASSGNWALAKKLAHARADAEKAAGYSDPAYDAALAMLDKGADGDAESQRTVLNLLGTHLAAVTGPEHFGSVYGSLKGGYTLDQGAARYDDSGHMVAHSPFIKDADGNIRLWQEGDPSAAPAASGSTPAATPGMTPSVASVASTLASALPAPVVAGFLGNFHIEGGYTGAQGDGGSASGIAQWHDDRAANFQKVVGKPVTEATPEDQAKFVLWEMQNPQAAGMTVKQRDAIMAAKTPAQAAALIDQFYERSDGKARSGRMQAATAFANLTGGGSGAPASGGASQFPIVIPGQSADQFRTLTAAEVKQRGLDPSQQYQLNTKTGGLSGLGKIDAGDQPLPGNPNLTGPAYLTTIPQNLATQVKALAEGRLPMPSSFALAKPYWQKMLQMTAQYDPTFDATAYQARKSAITAFTGNGKAAQVVGSVNRVANHLQTLWNESQKLAGPNTGWSVTDSLLARSGQAFEPADAKAYDTAAGFVAGELEKIARNSPGTEAGVDRVIKSLGRANSSKTRESAIKTAVDIISGAVDPLKDQYNSAFTNGSARPNIPWVTPKAQQIYRTIGGADLSLTSAGADSNQANDAAPAAHSGTRHPPAGATKTATGPNGQKAALVNGHWVAY